jgi:hypothetical protein
MMNLGRRICFMILLSIFGAAWPSLCALAQVGAAVVSITSPDSGEGQHNGRRRGRAIQAR